jgi:hypothetical protein
MSLTTTNGGYIDLLVKKYLGVVESSTSNSFGSEAAGNARPKIISNTQIYSYPIPSIAPSGPSSLNTPNTTITNTNTPTDLIQFGYVNTDGSISLSNNGLNLGLVYQSKTYPYIQYIQNLSLSAITS